MDSKRSLFKSNRKGLSHPLDNFSVNISDNAQFLDEKLNNKWLMGNIDLGYFYCGSWVCELNFKVDIEKPYKTYYITAKKYVMIFYFCGY